MNPTSSNPIADHFIARIAFNIASKVPAGHSVIFIAPDVEDEAFCAEQMKLIAESEGQKNTKPFLIFTSRDLYKSHDMGRGSSLSADFKAIIANNAHNRTATIVVIARELHSHSLGIIMIASNFIRLRMDGQIRIEKKRTSRGRVPSGFIPWEHFEDV